MTITPNSIVRMIVSATTDGGQAVAAGFTDLLSSGPSLSRGGKSIRPYMKAKPSSQYPDSASHVTTASLELLLDELVVEDDFVTRNDVAAEAFLAVGCSRLGELASAVSPDVSRDDLLSLPGTAQLSRPGRPTGRRRDHRW